MAEDISCSIGYAHMRRGEHFNMEKERQLVKDDNVETFSKMGGNLRSRVGTIWNLLAVALLLMVIVICTCSIVHLMKGGGANWAGPEEKTEDVELINSHTKLEQACISSIQDGKYQSALEQLDRRNNDYSNPQHLSKIISGAFKGDLVNMENLMTFTELLPNCKNKATSYTAIFNQMRKHAQLRSPVILAIQEVIKPCLESSLTLTTLNAELQRHINILIELWAEKIRRGDFEEIISFTKSSNLTKSGLTSHLPDIIKRCYGGPEDFTHLLNFISQLPLSSQLATGFLNTLNAMQEKQQLSFGRALQVAHKVKERMSTEGTADELSLLNNLKNMFPDLVRKLIWNGVCTIQTSTELEHLYTAGDYFKLQDGSRQVYTWIPVAAYWPDPKHKWVFQPADDDAKAFHIKSYFYRDSTYLCQRSGEIWDEERNDILCFPEVRGQQADCKWELEAVSTTGGGGQWQFRIKTSNNRSGTMQDVYLYAENDSLNKDKERRRAFTWIPGGVPDNAYWVLNCD